MKVLPTSPPLPILTRKALCLFQLPVRKKIPAITYDPAAGINAEPAVPGANTSSVEIRRLIVAVQDATYFTSIGSNINATNMHYTNV